MKLSFLTGLCCAYRGASFAPLVVSPLYASRNSAQSHTLLAASTNEDWQGNVVPSEGGVIQGCSVEPVGEEPITEWILTIDGVEADLGKFSAAIYKKIIADAKQQRFQGFRPGTIPPHLEPTYRAYTMDECARETVLEAMEQNQIRPFTNARLELVIEKVSIPPPLKKNGKKKTGGKKKMKGSGAKENEEIVDELAEELTVWQTFEDMKGAIDGGWKPGQSFSFVATNAKGQKMRSGVDTEGARPLGLNYNF